MLNAFRALGGMADNIRADDSAASGLYAIDPTRPVSLLVPRNLCFATDDIEFANGEIRLKDTANVAPGERKFFETYTRAFSWGAGGGANAAAFFASLDALPTEVRSLLENEFAMADLFNSDPVERTKAWFLRSRCFRGKGRDWYIPVIELARHGAQGLTPASDPEGRVQIEGTVSGEISVSRGAFDTLGLFYNFGVVVPQDQAYSLPLNIRGKTTDIAIRRDTSKTSERGDFRVPQIGREGNVLTFSYLMIGHPKFPRLSRGIFRALVRDTQIDKPDQVFDHVLFANRTKFFRLIAALEPHSGETVMALRRVAHIQLERISHCIGSREL
jgi:hypothetical protein